MKYNLSKIMKKAWSLVKKHGYNLSTALKESWKFAKKFLLKRMLLDRLNLMASDGNDLGVFVYNVYVSEWVKGDNDRTYLSIYETRRNSKHNTKFDYGYYDNIKNEYVPGKKDLCSGYGFRGSREYDVIEMG